MNISLSEGVLCFRAIFFHMNRGYNDPGQRRPWVPYRQWVRQQEERRRRYLPGYRRNQRAREALEVREGVRFPMEAEFQQIRGRAARQRALEIPFEDRPEEYRRQVGRRREELRRMHRDARVYEEEDPEGAEGRWDDKYGAWGGRYEEFLYGGEEAPEKVYKRLRFEDDVIDEEIAEFEVDQEAVESSLKKQKIAEEE